MRMKLQLLDSPEFSFQYHNASINSVTLALNSCMQNEGVSVWDTFNK